MKTLIFICITLLLSSRVSNQIIQIFKSKSFQENFLSQILTFLHEKDFDFLVTRGNQISYVESDSIIDPQSLNVYIKNNKNSTFSLNPTYDYNNGIFQITVPSFFNGSVDARFLMNYGFAKSMDSTGTIIFSFDLTVQVSMLPIITPTNPFTLTINATIVPSINVALNTQVDGKFDPSSFSQKLLLKYLSNILTNIQTKINTNSLDSLNGLGLQNSYQFEFSNIPSVFQVNISKFDGIIKKKYGLIENYQANFYYQDNLVPLNDSFDYKFKTDNGNHQMLIPRSIFNTMSNQVLNFENNFQINQTFSIDMFIINPYFFQRIAPDYNNNFDSPIFVSGRSYNLKINFMESKIYLDFDIQIANKTTSLLNWTHNCIFDLVPTTNLGMLNFKVNLRHFSVDITLNNVQSRVNEIILRRYVQTYLFNRLQNTNLFEMPNVMNLNSIFKSIKTVKIIDEGILISGDELIS